MQQAQRCVPLRALQVLTYTGRMTQHEAVSCYSLCSSTSVWRDSEQQQGRGRTAQVEGRWFTSEVKWNTKADAGLFLTSSGVPICLMRPLHTERSCQRNLP